MAERIAIVTGGGSGIGAACAKALAGAGWTVAVLGRRREPLEAVAAEVDGVHAFPVDVTDPDQVDAAFDAVARRFGRLDLLFNNAGRGGSTVEIDEVDVDEWRQVVDLNVTGTFLCTRAAFRIMRGQDPQGGRIVNNGSISAQVPRPLSIAYTATKHAVTGMTRSTSLDGRRFGITCGQIDIGNAATEMTAGMAGGVLQADFERRPEPTFSAEDVGAALVYMASLPPSATVQWLTVAATGMPFIGRG
ncbi:SDR family oxidoreductase [Amnibacterium kyonggiense]|uniref:NADP-dependent 3-hydroxy acid dehydrogenase YdfG n=1 Tax=Amnibacterium kyonggiense TaxID=595671 RepID=A0A4R7FS98_9MICO|nr:SDR family oxidoreductase [Amnibacterium kyonggiense]TDS80735.1 NADP-dependent 3-hydroxy acid dehydrogenase YdfG [Amnibacterium kyonggiense]